MRKSIASQYFDICIALIAASVMIVAAFIVNFSVSTYKNDRKNFITAITSDYAAATYSALYDGLSADEAEQLTKMYDDIFSRSNIGVILFDENGDALAASKASPCSHSDGPLSEAAIQSGTAEGQFKLGNLDGYFDSSALTVLYKLSISGKDYSFLAFMSTSSMMEYLKNLVIVFCIIFTILMLLVYPLLRYTVNYILRPIKEMTLAAKRFGEGDFSEKLEISEQNEMGFLANSLNEMASSLEAIEENRKSFISNVSHELRTPMTTIGGFVDGILDGTIPESSHRQYLMTVSEEINRLARLVRSMLNISKYEAGEMKLQTEDFDITALTVKTVLLFEKRIEAKNIDIQGLDTDRHFVNADMDLIQQVIFNLTENAVKFVNDGGYISYEFQTDGNLTYVRVRNSGEGLKKNEINKVFDRFYKTDESRGKDKNGVGLGLSIVRSIIKLHEGSILVRSKTDEYVEFEFTLKTAPAPSRHSDRQE
ncbi:MAG: sensor histidine kinase [Huintestinicola sp.]